jgi:hypothetical protein
VVSPYIPKLSPVLLFEQPELGPVLCCPGNGPPDAVVDDLLPLNNEVPVEVIVGLVSTVGVAPGVRVLVADGVTSGGVVGLSVGVLVDDGNGVGVAITVGEGGTVGVTVGEDVGVIPTVGVV